MRRIILSSFFCATLLMVLCLGVVNAEETILGSGTCGENLTWTLSSTGELRISGTGEMWDFLYNSTPVPWESLNTKISTVVIDRGVTSIGDSAFHNCYGLKSIQIPEGVTSIGSMSFSRCSYLLSITFPESLTTIGDAFYACTRLTELTIPGGVSTIGGGAFLMSGVETLKINEGVSVIDILAFYDCGRLTTISLPLSLKTINSSAFWECNQISNIYYNGTSEQWDQINVGIRNEPLALAQKFYGGSADQFKTIKLDLVSNGKVSLSDTFCPIGTTVSIITTPNIGYELARVQIDGVDIEGNTFIVTDNHIVTATFVGKTMKLSIGNIENGGISLSTQFPQYGSAVFVTPNPALGYELVHIQVDGNVINGNTFTVSDNHVITATFRVKTLTLTVGTLANGKVSISNLNPLRGSTVTAMATANIGYNLVSFQVDGVDIEGNTFIVTDNHIITATFAQYGVLLASGKCGIDVDWGLLESGQLIIRGNGPMYDYYSSIVSPWNSFWIEIKSVEILSGVTTIGDYSFANCRNLTGVMIPDSVTTIGGFAFIACSNLTNVVLPESVTVIKERAFYVCTNLESVVIPDGVTTIGGYAFYGCGKLTNIILPESVYTIGSDAFALCTSLASIVIPEGVTAIEASTFYNCGNLSSVAIPSSVTSIGERAFQACNSLTKVIIPGDVAYIGNYAFTKSANLTKVTFQSSAPTSFGIDVFPTKAAGGFIIYYLSDKSGWTTPLWNGYYTDALDNVNSDYSTLDENDRNSQNIKFSLNDQTYTATVGDNSTNNNNSGYYGAQLGNVVIPGTVTRLTKTYKVVGIGQYAFSDNDFITSVELGTNVRSVDATAFLNSSAFDSFVVSPSNTQFKSIDGILFDSVSYYLYIYPSAIPASTYTVPETVKTIGIKAFYGNKNLTKIIVPNSITSIGFGAFEDCVNLKEITLPFIGRSNASSDSFAYVFGSNGSYLNSSKVPTRLESVTITGGTLRTGAFENMPYIQSLSLPALATSIPASSFNGCNSLQSIIFMETKAVSEVGQVVLPEEINTIGDFAFYGCSGLESVVIPEGVTTIGNQAFSGCTNLRSFSVHENNPSYYSDKWGTLFSKDLSSLITYPSKRIWPYYNVPNETTTILTGAFNACSNLVNLYIPATVTNLQSSSIANCPGVTICVYLNSPADTYTGNNNLTAWYMDNYTLQGIDIYSLPEDTVYPLGQEDFSGLYLVADYGGKQLQLDDYELNYDVNLLGTQTVTVEHPAGTASFEIVLFDATSEQVLDFGAVVAPEGTMALVAVYDTFGKMICIESAIISNSQGKAVISNNDYNKMSKAKLFVLDGLNLAPQREEYRIQK